MNSNRTTVFSNAPARADGKQRACDRCDKVNQEMGQMFRDESRGKGARRVHRCATDRAGKKRFQCDDGTNGDASGDPRSLAPTETLRITNINIAVRTISRISDCNAGPAGAVVPRVESCGNSARKSKLAASAPDNWLST